MKIVILGGTGLIGEALKENFILNHEVECMGREAFISFETLLGLSLRHTQGPLPWAVVGNFPTERSEASSERSLEALDSTQHKLKVHIT